MSNNNIISSSSDNDGSIRNTVRMLALLNSVSHKGKPDAGAVLGRIMAERADLRSRSQRIKAITGEVISELQGLTLEEQIETLSREFPDAVTSETERKSEISRRDSEKVASLPALEMASLGNVVTRFPPEPNGFMHIGHAKAAILGSEYAKRYDGKFIVRFDDTNPAAEKKEYYEAFLEALSWLGIKPDGVRSASDDMPNFYGLAEKMIENSKAYACTCTQDQIRAMRAEGKSCAHRTQPVSTNLKLWHGMKDGAVEKGSVVLRYSGDMSSINTTMRDPVLFRIVEEPHPIQGTKYRVWPTYDFDGPVEDSLDGVTHAMRSKEYELRDELYYSILRDMDLRVPRIVEFSRLTLKDTTVSKRSLRRLIEDGKVEGWDDPRLPTISGLRRRGFLPESIKEFILGMGLSKVESEPTWDLLESINRRILDPIARRYFFVPEPITLTIKDSPDIEVVLKNHPEKKEYGSRTVKTGSEFLVPRRDFETIAPGESVRLIEAYNIELLSKGPEGLLGKYAGDEKKGNKKEGAIPKVQWANKEEAVPLSVLVPGPLLVNGEFNPESLKTLLGFGEKAIGEMSQGEIVQFIRFGFCRMDEKGIAILAHK